ncbi:hypothetical protein INR49_032716 [Caranx melampygus]|nr:hypothetical protein INR49_032716 [Caranx melampygus]
MENKEATRTCGQCHREVAEANFALHETHCSRFLCVCPDCDESVPKEQLDQHREEQHTEVRCSKCNQKMERRHLMDHELPVKELGQHREVCGSRTELCRECNRYVKLRDLAEHGLTCSAADAGSGPPHADNASPHTTAQSRVSSSSRGHNTSVQDEDVTNHMPIPATTWDDYDSEDSEDGSSRLEEFGQLSSAYKSTSMSAGSYYSRSGRGGDPDQISTCPHCHLALPVLTLQWHQTKCQIYTLLK